MRATQQIAVSSEGIIMDNGGEEIAPRIGALMSHRLFGRPVVQASRITHGAGLTKLIGQLLFVIAILAASLLPLLGPRPLDGSDFVQIAWQPGQQLLARGSVDAGYPYPLWTLVFMLPFVLLPRDAAILLWLLANVVMLAGSVVILARLLRWPVSAPLLLVAAPAVGYYLPVLTSLWLGQLTVFSLLMLMAVTYAVQLQHWRRVGILLGLSLIKPHVMILVTAALLALAVWHRRWQTITSFTLVVLALIGVTLPFAATPRQIIGGGINDHLHHYLHTTSTF